MKNNYRTTQQRIFARMAVGLTTVLIFSSCDQAVLEHNVPPIEQEINDGVAIVYPQESAQFYVGDFVDIHATVGDPAGFSAAVLSVNDQVYRRDTFASTVKNGDLYQPWVPEQDGIYALQIHCETAAGGQRTSNVVNVYVGMREETSEEPAEQAPPEEETTAEEEECPIPMASSSGYPNCRSGPGTAYNVITSLKPGQSFPVTAVSGSGSWWEIEYSTSGATCWVWDNLVDICGNTDDVPVIIGKEKDAEAPEEPQQPAEQPQPDDPIKEPKPDPTWDPSSGPTAP